MTSPRTILACLLTALLLSACTTKECVVHNPHRGQPLSLNPSIEEISVKSAVHGGIVEIDAELRVPGAANVISAGGSVRVRSTRSPDLPFGPTFPMSEPGPYHLERSLYRLNFGPYEACVEAGFTPGPAIELPGTPGPPPVEEPSQAATTVYTDRQAFFVDAAEPCYTWADEAAGTAGWAFSGISDVATGGAIADPNAQPFFGRFELDVPLDVPGLLVLPGALPGSPPNGLWQFDYVSPDLSAETAWQGLGEIAFRVYTNGSSIQAQPIFTYEYEDGSLHTFAPVDDEGDWIFYEVVGTATVYPPTMRPGDVTLTGIRIRMFGEFVTTTSEFMVHLQIVCPMPSRFPSVLRAVLGELQARQGTP